MSLNFSETARNIRNPETKAPYRALDVHTAVDYVAGIPELRSRLSGPLTAREVGDGNLNMVFIVGDNHDAVVVKQALPYVRLVGESWPLPLSRAYYEHSALCVHASHAGAYLPTVFHYDADLALIVMSYLTPHITLRKHLIVGGSYRPAAEALGAYLAKVLYGASDFALSPAHKNRLQAQFAGNTAMCKITEDLIFDEPYYDAPLNRYSPGLSATVQSIRADHDLRRRVQALKFRFRTAGEALLHGDLHTGSVMINELDTKVIDPEFAFYGPMAFDLGMLAANFITASFATERTDLRTEAVADLFNAFEAEFTKLYVAGRTGSVGVIFNPEEAAAAAAEYINNLRLEAAGFAGCEIIRRIIGLAHLEEFTSIADAEIKTAREAVALQYGRELIGGRAQL